MIEPNPIVDLRSLIVLSTMLIAALWGMRVWQLPEMGD